MTRVLLPDGVVENIREQGKTWPPGRERGGLLLGYRKDDAIQIESATFPGPWDYASPTLFQRSERGHRLKALREWVRSGHTVDWVGEWHTHPGGMAHPSYTDTRSWRSLVRHTKLPMVFLIFSDTQMYVGLQSPSACKVKPLSLEEQGNTSRLFS